MAGSLLVLQVLQRKYQPRLEMREQTNLSVSQGPLQVVEVRAGCQHGVHLYHNCDGEIKITYSYLSSAAGREGGGSLAGQQEQRAGQARQHFGLKHDFHEGRAGGEVGHGRSQAKLKMAAGQV